MLINFFSRGMFKFLDEDLLAKLMSLITNTMGKPELKFGSLENLNSSIQWGQIRWCFRNSVVKVSVRSNTHS